MPGLSVIFLGMAASALGQMQGAAPGSSTHATQLPLSGRGASGAVVRQSASLSPGSSVNTLSSQVEVHGAYSGSVPGKDSPQGAILLTIEDAVRRALTTNLGIVGADASSQQARGQRLQARSALLPSISASVAENAAKVDLAAEGFSAGAFGSTLPIAFPTVVGPFHYYDVHGSLQQNLLDFTAIHNLKSANHSANAASLDARQAREEVVLTVAGLYLQLLASLSELEQQQVEVQYAEASYKQAQAQADAGTKAPIEANRSLVELQTERQRLRSQQGDVEKQKNQLARVIGLPLGIEIQLAEKLDALHPATPDLEAVIRRAWAQRQDLKSAEAQLNAA